MNIKTIVRLDRPDYSEPLYYNFDDDDWNDFTEMIWDGISRNIPQMITSEEKDESCM